MPGSARAKAVDPIRVLIPAENHAITVAPKPEIGTELTRGSSPSRVSGRTDLRADRSEPILEDRYALARLFVD